MQFIKKILKNAYIYDSLQRFRAQKVLRKWTAHDQEMLEFYSKFVSRGALCFDIGANIGNRAKIFLKLQANVIAVEPQEECVKMLRTEYEGNPNITIVQKAVGEAEGEAELIISDASTISSLSPEWIESVRRSGRFSEYHWDKKQIVQITTLDKLIDQYGTPSFIKIDVEGFEYQVVKGLSKPIKMLSLEFTPEFIESTFKCIDHLQGLGAISLNYSINESMYLALEKWVTPEKIVKILSSFRNDNNLFGDVYVQFLT